ncbi:hypothetical protein QTP70_005837 [Hemibagrus guttatus]|uniref:3'-5' exonuclease domain-containing protein n=1 Tax=Hemibagrus guttatus TaxID=175788 RepID=A0AAE0QK60_9TELE|nr:hypothetical protein QTP70_005837 [Hemibagrus guttatus]
MSLDDYRFLESFKRKRIRLTTKGGTFVGVVQRINLNKTIILDDVAEVQSGCRFVGAKLFFGQEILNVEFTSSTNKDGLGNEDHDKVGQLSLAEFQPYRNTLLSGGDDDDDDDDDDDEKEQFVNYVVVDEFHEKFGPAIMHIRKQKLIGLGLDGVGAFQSERLCWLQMAVKNKVYLFDILLLGARAFRNGLSSILESTDILKVMHDCRRISGCLMAQFGVNLLNVFDTQVADVMQFYAETGGFLPTRVSTLQEVISFHLKMPLSSLSSLSIKDQLCMENKEVWYVRPCPAPLLRVMALSVIHLQPLRLMLLDALMSDYTSLVDSYLKTGQENPVRTEDIGKTGLELPQELREIELIKFKRQKWAVDHYNLTEDGLLDRFSIKATSDPDLEIQEQPEMLDSSMVAGKTYPNPAVMSTIGGGRKGRELADMMERRKVDILCVQETRWKGSKARSIGAGFKLFYYGVDSKRNGVGVVLKEEFVRNVLEVKRVSDRVMSLKLEIEGVMLNVVSGYAPQVGCELEEKERFWSELDEVMESIPTGERVVIGADFNGHVGEGNTSDEEVMGKFEVKERNLEGQMVVDFAKRMDMAVVNTYFQKREEHRVTYKSGGR